MNPITKNVSANGKKRPQLAESIGRLDAMLDGLADAIPAAVALSIRDSLNGAVKDAVEAALAEYRRCFRDPATIHATCEDYRAGASIDLEHDAADAGKKIACPLLVLWGEKGVVGRLYDPLAIWRENAVDVTGLALPCGHFLPEEAPEETLAALEAFLAG